MSNSWRKTVSAPAGRAHQGGRGSDYAISIVCAMSIVYVTYLGQTAGERPRTSSVPTGRAHQGGRSPGPAT